MQQRSDAGGLQTRGQQPAGDRSHTQQHTDTFTEKEPRLLLAGLSEGRSWACRRDDDFANGYDCLRQSLPGQTSSSSSSSSSSFPNHHNNTFLPLMTHWALLHNSHRHIASTRMSVRFLINGSSSHLNTHALPPCFAYPCKVLLSGAGRRRGEEEKRRRGEEEKRREEGDCVIAGMKAVDFCNAYGHHSPHRCRSALSGRPLSNSRTVRQTFAIRPLI
ncbi:hypothetical protein EYF80_003844 [Liparis tanakae]|uniref:Uncharacterized protein n=1 Tax=Liparis tanakae TaxID=230148 RepID=A0A4Z2J7C9_9TELE|nr:hypothetical protein EYF80_003844 [Liparis tanakae]